MSSYFNDEEALRLAREMQGTFTRAGGKSGSRRPAAPPINRENVRPTRPAAAITRRPPPVNAPARMLVTDFESFLSASRGPLGLKKVAGEAPRAGTVPETPRVQQTRAGHGLGAAPAPAPQAAAASGQGPASAQSQWGGTLSSVAATAGPSQQSQPVAAVDPSLSCYPPLSPTRPPGPSHQQPVPPARQPGTAATTPAAGNEPAPAAHQPVAFGLGASRHAREPEPEPAASPVPAPKPAASPYIDFPPSDPRHKMIKIDPVTGRYNWKNDEGHWEFHTFGGSEDCKYVPDEEAQPLGYDGLGDPLHAYYTAPRRQAPPVLTLNGDDRRRAGPGPEAPALAPALDPRAQAYSSEPIFDPEERLQQLKAQFGASQQGVGDNF